ncbi:MAG: ABC transporter permease subunit [Candidatus Parvarchaeum sp.]
MLELVFSVILDTMYSWARMLIALFISMIIALFTGIAAARSKKLNKILMPIVDILQTLPILAFFPFAIYLFVFYLPGSIGVNAAVIFLIVTSMLWNIIFGVYQAIISLPSEYFDMARIYKLNLYQRLRKIFIPAALPRMSEQMSLSWAIGLFYLVTSEIFSAGTKNYAVKHGIGVEFVKAAATGNFYLYIYSIIIFVLFVIATRLLLFERFDKFANRYYLKDYKKRRRDIFTFNYFSGKRAMLNEKIKYKLVLIGNVIFYVIIGSIIGFIIYKVIPFVNLQLLSKLVGYEGYSLLSLAFSFLRVWGAFIAIMAVSIPLSIKVVFLSNRTKRYLLLFQIFASIPATILLPAIAELVYGNSELLAFIIYFLSGLWYVIFSIVATTKYLPESINEVKKIFHLNGIVAWKKIYLKAIMPGVITGAVTGIAAEWNASIVAEYFSAGSGKIITSVSIGMGKALNVALANNNLLLMGVLLANMVAMIIIVNYFVWRRLYNRVNSVYS